MIFPSKSLHKQVPRPLRVCLTHSKQRFLKTGPMFKVTNSSLHSLARLLPYIVQTPCGLWPDGSSLWYAACALNDQLTQLNASHLAQIEANNDKMCLKNCASKALVMLEVVDGLSHLEVSTCFALSAPRQLRGCRKDARGGTQRRNAIKAPWPQRIYSTLALKTTLSASWLLAFNHKKCSSFSTSLTR